MKDILHVCGPQAWNEKNVHKLEMSGVGVLLAVKICNSLAIVTGALVLPSRS